MRQSNTISSGTTFTAYLTDPRLWDCFIVGWYTNGPAKGGSEFCFLFFQCFANLFITSSKTLLVPDL